LELEARGRRGEKVEQELGAVRRAHPNLVGLSDRLTVEIRNHGAVECQGIGWLAIDAKAHCSGTLNEPPPARLGLAASPPEPYCIGASSCDLMFSACHKKGLKTECNFTCFPWDGCCIGSCDSRER
jgi:hypothetical protein